MKASMILLLSGTALALAACNGAGNGETPALNPAPNAAPVQCQPGDYQDYVGRLRSELPEAPPGRLFRVACSTCAVTMDYRGNRVTFGYDSQTNRITRVSCG